MGQFRFLTAGESHGKGLTMIIEGLPSGLPLAERDISPDLGRRQGGYGRGGRMKIEKDHAEITAGVRHGRVRRNGVRGAKIASATDNRQRKGTIQAFWPNGSPRRGPSGTRSKA